MTLYVFDMDGTLTEPSLPMAADFSAIFYRWQQTHKSYIATGSKYDKVVKQLPLEVINSFAGIYASMGNELVVKGKIAYQKKFEASPLLYQKLEDYRKNTAYPYERYPNYIEERPGMINFSVLGRNCPYAARLKYTAWDQVSKEREKMMTELTELFPQYDIAMGGPISLDITPKGCGKEQIAYHLREQYPDEEIIFIGDKTFVGGNDYKLAHALSLLHNTQVVQVNCLKDVLNFLENN
ncbi:MAG: HAD-IIB family hydrolase [Alphaproteobacteria bacterium]|nr:HAD-IIB family hydrolase [Alphaproteobacteria bacterium]